MQLQTLQPVLRSWHQKLDSNAIGIRGYRNQQKRPANGRPCPQWALAAELASRAWTSAS